MHLLVPFRGNFPVTFSFGVVPSDPAIKQKYLSWGLVGHNGVDFGLPLNTPVLATDRGEVIKSGLNGNFGTSVTIRHVWGESLYAHLEASSVFLHGHVDKGQEIALSGKSGFVTGPHLHFAIKPASPDLYNGYGGYIDPQPFLTFS